MNLLKGNRVSTEGRLSQQAYILCFTLPFLVTLALTAMMFISPPWFAQLGIVGVYGAGLGWLLLMALGDALNIKRYHDLGHSGRLYRLCRPGIVVLPLLAFALDFFIPAQMASAGDMDATMHMINQAMAPTLEPVPFTLLALTVAGVAINVGYLSFMPGQAGPNEHGPDPRGGAGHVPGVVASGRGDAETGDDPVKRALAEYHKQQAAPKPQARAAAQGTRPVTASSSVRQAPATFGRKR